MSCSYTGKNGTLFRNQNTNSLRNCLQGLLFKWEMLPLSWQKVNVGCNCTWWYTRKRCEKSRWWAGLEFNKQKFKSEPDDLQKLTQNVILKTNFCPKPVFSKKHLIQNLTRWKKIQLKIWSFVNIFIQKLLRPKKSFQNLTRCKFFESKLFFSCCLVYGLKMTR